uniref:Putative secreted protein n=1 Tax=Amblyomma cajennense TaxID=34607 RepID=A0A023FB34_AMBCJ
MSRELSLVSFFLPVKCLHICPLVSSYMCLHVNVRVKLSFMYFPYTPCCPLSNVFKKVCANFGSCDMRTF